MSDTTKRQPLPVSFRGQEVERLLAARADQEQPLGSVAKRDLERYYATLDRELLTVELTEAEALLLCDVANGTLWEPTSIPYLWAEVADGIRLDGLDRKWEVDGDALVAKIRALTPGQAIAVVDALERFWQSPGEDMGETVRKVGLVR